MTPRLRPLALLCLLTASGACAPASSPGDEGSDAGASVETDGGPDEQDAGGAEDAGADIDAGGDAGADFDAGTDAGPPDVDAGTDADAGSPDAGADGGQIDPGPDAGAVELPGAGACADPYLIESSVAVVTDTTGAPSTINVNDCVEGGIVGGRGPERFYRVTLEAGAGLHASHVPSTSEYLSSLYLLTDCADTGSCLVGESRFDDTTPREITYRNLTGAPLDVFLVVDGWLENDLGLGALTVELLEPIVDEAGDHFQSGGLDVALPSVVPHDLNPAEDVRDCFDFSLAAPANLELRVSDGNGGCPVDTGLTLSLYPADATEPAGFLARESQGPSGPCPSIFYAATEGDYTVCTSKPAQIGPIFGLVTSIEELTDVAGADYASALVVDVPSDTMSHLAPGDDVDCLKIAVAAPATLDIRTTDGEGGCVDESVRVVVTDEAGDELAGTAGTCSYLLFDAAAGNYAVCLSRATASADPLFGIVTSIRELTDDHGDHFTTPATAVTPPSTLSVDILPGDDRDCVSFELATASDISIATSAGNYVCDDPVIQLYAASAAHQDDVLDVNIGATCVASIDYAAAPAGGYVACVSSLFLDQNPIVGLQVDIDVTPD